jgi:hypothetical protein
MAQNTENDICCPKFEPAPWAEKVFNWENKKFIKDSVFTLYYMPVNFGSAMRKIDKKVKEAGAEIPGWLCLSDHTSPWNMDLYLAVDKMIPNAKNLSLSGKFVSKVYEGPYKETGNWQKHFAGWCAEKGYKPVKTYMWYTTCPKCAKKHGKNYVVLVAEIKTA